MNSQEKAGAGRSKGNRVSGDKIVEALSRQHGGQQGIERRRSERKPWPTHVSVEWREEGEARSLRLLAQDVSRHGFCFFASTFPPAGAEVLVRFEGISEKPQIGGVVRYHHPLAWTFYRVGVEFHDPGGVAQEGKPASG